MISVIVLAQKGGVAKTLTTANVAAALALEGLRVLQVDFDPQGDLSASWGITEDDVVPRVEDVLASEDTDPRAALVDFTPEGSAGRLALIPAGSRLRAMTAPLMEGGAPGLRDLLSALEDDFDFALVDTPAGDTIFGRQAIGAADQAIVTVLPGYQEMRALQRGLTAIDEQADQEGVELGLLGVLLVNAPSSSTTREYREFLRGGDFDLFRTVVPRRQPVTNHARYGLPTVLFEPENAVALSYRRVAREVLGRLHGDDSTWNGHGPVTGGDTGDSTWNDSEPVGAGHSRWRPRRRRRHR